MFDTVSQAAQGLIRYAAGALATCLPVLDPQPDLGTETARHRTSLAPGSRGGQGGGGLQLPCLAVRMVPTETALACQPEDSCEQWNHSRLSRLLSVRTAALHRPLQQEDGLLLPAVAAASHPGHDAFLS